MSSVNFEIRGNEKHSVLFVPFFGQRKHSFVTVKNNCRRVPFVLGRDDQPLVFGFVPIRIGLRNSSLYASTNP